MPFAARGAAWGPTSIRGKGSRMGPDLSNIGGTQPLPLIRESILQPSKDPAFWGKEAVTVTMKNGAVIKGIARNRSNYSIQLIDTKGDLQLISMSDVKDLTVREQSSMPGDYGTRLSAQELRDLLAYLAQQSVRRPVLESTKR
jgi:putative heme-binding domain-containing protein